MALLKKQTRVKVDLIIVCMSRYKLHCVLSVFTQFCNQSINFSISQSINQLEVHRENTQRIHIVEVIIDADIDSV